jgi:hypothetical protein
VRTKRKPLEKLSTFQKAIFFWETLIDFQLLGTDRHRESFSAFLTTTRQDGTTVLGVIAFSKTVAALSFNAAGLIGAFHG